MMIIGIWGAYVHNRAPAPGSGAPSSWWGSDGVVSAVRLGTGWFLVG